MFLKLHKIMFQNLQDDCDSGAVAPYGCEVSVVSYVGFVDAIGNILQN